MSGWASKTRLSCNIREELGWQMLHMSFTIDEGKEGERMGRGELVGTHTF